MVARPSIPTHGTYTHKHLQIIVWKCKLNYILCTVPWSITSSCSLKKLTIQNATNKVWQWVTFPIFLSLIYRINLFNFRQCDGQNMKTHFSWNELCNKVEHLSFIVFVYFLLEICCSANLTIFRLGDLLLFLLIWYCSLN